MKIAKQILLIIILFLLMLISCDNDDGGPSRTELLTDGVWDGEKLVIKINNDIQDIQSLTGISFEFKPDGELISYADYSDDTFYLEWSFNDDRTVLFIDDGTILAFKIIVLTGTELDFSLTEYDDGEKVELIYHFNK